MSDFILHGCSIEGDGSGHTLQGEEITKLIKDDKLAWVHLDASSEDTRHWLEDNVSYLDPIILDALLAKETRPRMFEHKGGIMLILRGMNLNEGQAEEDMISLRLWVDQSRIISTGLRKLKTVQDIRDMLLEGKGPADAGEFVTLILTRLFTRMEPVLSALDDRTDEIEANLIDNPNFSDRNMVANIRKKAIVFRRYIAPQRDMMMQMRMLDMPWLSELQMRHLQEDLDRLMRYVEDLDAIRERAQIIKEEIATTIADKMNHNIYVLSIVAAVFLPLGFLTGLLGINVGGLPGTESDIAFWVVCGLCVLSGIGIMGLFKALKWI